MALQKQTVSVNLGQTIDQKDGQFTGDPDSFLVLKDWARNKFKQLDKRPGTETCSTDVITSFPNPLSIGTTDIPSSVFSHKDQLLLQNKGALYSWNDDQEAWSFKSHYYPLMAKAETAIAASDDLFGANTGYFNGIKYTAYINKVSGLMLRVEDVSTGNVIRPDVVLDTNLAPNFDIIGTPQVLVFSNAVIIIWQYSVFAPSSASLKIAIMNTTDGSVTSTSTLVSTAATAYNPSPDPTTAGVGFQAVVCNKAGVGERAFIVYQSTGLAVTVRAITSTGAFDNTIGIYSGATTIDRGFGIFYSENNQRLYVGYQNSVPTVLILNFTSSSITQVFLGTISAPVNTYRYRNFAFQDDPRSATSVYFLTDSCVRVSYSNGVAYADVIYAQKLTATALDGTAYAFAHGMSLAARLIKDTERQTIYVPAQQVSNLQSTLFILDLLKGKPDGTSFVQAKLSYGDHEATYPTMLPDVWLDDRVVQFATTRKVRIIGEVTIGSGPTAQLPEAISFQVGISANTIELAPEFSLRSEFLAGSQFLPGGYLGMYDGAEFCEHNYFIQPEYLALNSPSSTSRIGVQVVQQGSASLPEITKYTVYAGNLYQAVVGPSSYVQAFSYTIAPTSLKFAFAVDGVGSANPGGNSVLASVLSTDTKEQVAQKLAAALQTVAVVGQFQVSVSGNEVTVTNNVNASVTDATAINFTTPSTGPDAGAHGVGVIWSWVDNNGLQHRSAPAISSITTNGYPISIVAYCPIITNRRVSSLRAEVYLTKVDGTVLKRLILAGNGAWSESGCAVSFLVLESDDDIADGESLYTTGGVLPNNSIGACSAVSVFKNRLVVTGMDKSSVQYSKTVQPNLPVEIASELYIQTSSTNDQVVGAVQMDDKLVVFKEESIVSYAGDGANDLGQGVTLSQPIDVASDCGCTNANSICLSPDGLYFRSKLGIQLIDRGLSVRYPGIQVKDYNDRSVGKALILKDDQNVRELRFILSSGDESIVFDYLSQQWGAFTHYEGTDACIWSGAFTRCDIDGRVYVERRGTWVDTFPDPADDVSYSPTLVTQWLKMTGEQVYQRIWRMMILGQLKSPHTLQFKVYYDYDDTAYDSYSFDSTNISGGTGQDASVYQPEIHLKRQKCDAIKVEMTVVPNSGTEQSLTLTDISFLAGLKQGLNKVSAAKKL